MHACVNTPFLQPEAKPGKFGLKPEACALACCAQTAIFGDGETEPSKDTAVSICHETCRCGLPSLLANKLALLDFEARKDAAQARPGFPAAWQPRRQLVAPSRVQSGCCCCSVSLGCCHLWCPATHLCCPATRLADAWETHGRPVDSLSSSRLVGCLKLSMSATGWEMQGCRTLKCRTSPCGIDHVVLDALPAAAPSVPCCQPCAGLWRHLQDGQQRGRAGRPVRLPAPRHPQHALPGVRPPPEESI